MSDKQLDNNVTAFTSGMENSDHEKAEVNAGKTSEKQQINDFISFFFAKGDGYFLLEFVLDPSGYDEDGGALTRTFKVTSNAKIKELIEVIDDEVGSQLFEDVILTRELDYLSVSIGSLRGGGRKFMFRPSDDEWSAFRENLIGCVR